MVFDGDEEGGDDDSFRLRNVSNASCLFSAVFQVKTAIRYSY